MSRAASASGQIPLALALNERPGFDQFVSGGNAEAITSIRQLQKGALYIWAQPGSGITHLLQAVCIEASEQDKRVAYIPLREHNTFNPQVLDQLEAMNIVCLDDMDAVAGKPEWEQPLLHLYNRLRDAGGTILIGAHHSPQAINIELADLKSRLNWELVYHLNPLTDEDRIAVLQKRAAARAFELPDEAADYLVKRVPRDLASLIQILDELEKATLAEQRKITIPFVKSFLQK